MKKNQIVELRSKSIEELKRLLEETQSEIKKLIMELKSRKLKNTASIEQKRKDIARILTFVREKELV